MKQESFIITSEMSKQFIENIRKQSYSLNGIQIKWLATGIQRLINDDLFSELYDVQRRELIKLFLYALNAPDNSIDWSKYDA